MTRVVPAAAAAAAGSHEVNGTTYAASLVPDRDRSDATSSGAALTEGCDS